MNISTFEQLPTAIHIPQMWIVAGVICLLGMAIVRGTLQHWRQF